MRRALDSLVLVGILGLLLWGVGASADPLDLLDDAVDALQERWLFRYDVDWNAFVNELVGGEPMGEVFHPTGSVAALANWQLPLDFCDLHAGFFTPEEVDAGIASSLQFVEDAESGRSATDDLSPCGGIVDGDVAYLWIPATGDVPVLRDGQAYLRAKGAQIARAVESLDAAALRGWVIDLRQHLGGYHEAGLIGLQAFLPPGRLFGFAGAQEDGTFVIDTWIERRGIQFLRVEGESTGLTASGDGANASGQKQSVIASVPLFPYVLKSSEAPIAVLTSASTASAAEMLLVALRQNPHVRVFGESTSGVNTDVDGCLLPDGSAFTFSTAYLASPDGHIYRGTGERSAAAPWEPATYCVPGERIPPDEPKAVPHMQDEREIRSEVEKMRTLGPSAYLAPRYDPAYNAALAWIREQSTGTPQGP